MSVALFCPALEGYGWRHFQRQDGKSAVKTATAEDTVCVCIHIPMCFMLACVRLCVLPDWVWHLRPRDETGIHPV